MKSGCCSLAIAAAVALTVAGARAQTTWEDELTFEIDMVYDCEVAFLSRVVERRVAGKEVVMARVHCTDQRNFDAQRLDPYEPFIFTECEDYERISC